MHDSISISLVDLSFNGMFTDINGNVKLTVRKDLYYMSDTLFNTSFESSWDSLYADKLDDIEYRKLFLLSCIKLNKRIYFHSLIKILNRLSK